MELKLVAELNKMSERQVKLDIMMKLDMVIEIYKKVEIDMEVDMVNNILQSVRDIQTTYTSLNDTYICNTTKSKILNILNCEDISIVIKDTRIIIYYARRKPITYQMAKRKLNI